MTVTGEERRRTGPVRPLFSLEEAAAVTRGRLAGDPGAGPAGVGAVVVTGVEVDSRHVRQGDLFCALPGERTDGHEFVGRAFGGGAVTAMVSRDPGTPLPPGRSYLFVGDTLAGLTALARHHRDRFDLPVVGVTGSVGKTTTKDLIASVLGASLNVLYSPGNLNTDIGLPLAIFELGPEHDAACLEMGMRGSGEITRLAALARPTVGVVTNIGPVHIELLGSVEAIARAKEELLEALPASGTAVLNADDPIVAGMAGRHRGRLASVTTYGLEPGADVTATDIKAGPAGETSFRARASGADLGPFTVPLAGRHSVLNSLAAIAVGLRFGLGPADMARGLAHPRLSAMRQEVTEVAGVRVVNDAYNAGPASMAASVELLSATRSARGGRAVAVLGDMLELGDLTEEAHRDLGRKVAEAAVDYLVVVGPRSAALADEARRAGLGPRRVSYLEGGPASNRAAAGLVLEFVCPGDTVLVKASRGMQFEEVAESLLAGLGKREAGTAGRPAK